MKLNLIQNHITVAVSRKEFFLPPDCVMNMTENVNSRSYPLYCFKKFLTTNVRVMLYVTLVTRFVKDSVWRAVRYENVRVCWYHIPKRLTYFRAAAVHKRPIVKLRRVRRTINLKSLYLYRFVN